MKKLKDGCNLFDDSINKMRNNNIEAIVSGIYSENSLICLNAILFGAKLKIKSADFMKKLKELCDVQDIHFFGTPLSTFAIAAHCYLNGLNYEGDDIFIKELIESEFLFYY